MKEKFQKDYPVNEDFWDYDKCSFEVPENQDIPPWEEPDMGQLRGYRVGKYLLSSSKPGVAHISISHANLVGSLDKICKIYSEKPEMLTDEDKKS